MPRASEYFGTDAERPAKSRLLSSGYLEIPPETALTFSRKRSKIRKIKEKLSEYFNRLGGKIAWKG